MRTIARVVLTVLGAAGLSGMAACSAPPAPQGHPHCHFVDPSPAPFDGYTVCNGVRIN